MPLIIFSFMYQPNVPGLYHELKKKDIKNIKRILVIATTIAVVAYTMAGYFGYATFVMRSDVEQIMEKQNILEGPYAGNVWILIAQYMLLIGVVLASPICALPVKYSIEELYLGQNRRMSKR